MFRTQCHRYCDKVELDTKIRRLRRRLREADTVILQKDLRAMKRVLRRSAEEKVWSLICRLGFINKDDVIEIKGRVACEINAADELVLTGAVLLLPSCHTWQNSCLTEFSTSSPHSNVLLFLAALSFKRRFQSVIKCQLSVACRPALLEH